MDAIEGSKNAGLERLIYALGIRNVGEVAAWVPPLPPQTLYRPPLRASTHCWATI